MLYPLRTCRRSIRATFVDERRSRSPRQMLSAALLAGTIVILGFFIIFSTMRDRVGLDSAPHNFDQLFIGTVGRPVPPQHISASTIVPPQSGLRSAKLFRSFTPERSRSQRTFQAEFKMATIFTVSTSAELMDALASANGGDTIELAGGSYGNLSLWWGSGFNVQFDSTVTIKSADPENPAVFSKIGLHTVSNLAFDSITIDYDYASGDPLNVIAFDVKNSTNISVTNSTFDGDLASGTSTANDGFGSGFGFSVRDSSGIIVENNEFYNWHRAALFGQTDNIVVSGNEVYEVSSDGFDFAAVTGVLIENNYFHDFRKSDLSGAHMDMIQFWTSGTNTPSTDIIIRGNILDTGQGDTTQSIFMRNERVDSYGDGQEMFYRNIMIEDNTIYNGHIHGITVGETDGLIIRNNTLVEAEGGKPLVGGNVSIPAINVASDSISVQIVQNAVFSIAGYSGQTDWLLQNNAFIQNNDSDLPGYYGDVFVTSSLDASSGQHNFIAAPGMMLDLLNAGSALTKFNETPSTLTAMFNVNSHTDDGLVFDASLSSAPQDAKFTWDFGDGSTADGPLIKHTFSGPGRYDVNLTITLPDGSTATEFLKVGIAGDELIKFDGVSGTFESLSHGTTQDAEAEMNLVIRETGSAFVMSGSGVQATVEHEAFSRLFGADNFDLSLSLTATNGSESAGELFRVHGHFLSFVNSDGSFTFIMGADDGSKLKMSTSGVNLVDGQTHELTIIFDGFSNSVGIWVDGELNAIGEITGNLANTARDLTFGDPWGGNAFDGEISSFSLSSEKNDFALFKGSDEALQSSMVVDEAETTVQPTGPSPAEPEEPRSDTVPDDAETTTQPTDASPAVPEVDPSPVVDQPVDEQPTSDETSVAPEVPREDGEGALAPFLLGGYELDIAGIANSNAVKLYDDAKVIDTPDGLAITFDGRKDYANLGRLEQFENSQKIAFSVDFTSNNSDDNSERLVWNHLKLGLTLEGDAIRVHVGNNDEHFAKGFMIDGLDLNDGNRHTAIVMVDAEADRLQVIVDDVLVLDEQNTDFDFVGAGGREWGWALGTPWNRWFEGEVYDFQVSDDFQFLDQAPADEGLLLT